MDHPAALGEFVHVFVDRTTRRPTAIPQQMRDALQQLVIERPDDDDG